MGDVDHGDAEPLVQVPDLVLHVLAQLLVEGAERLVHQHELGLEDQRPGERDALLLAAGELRRAAAGEAAHLHHVERALHLRLDLGLGQLAHLEREGEVLADGHVRKERVVLEHHADAALVRRDVVDRPAVEADLAVGRGLEAGEHHQAGGLARARGAEHGQELALADAEVQVHHDERLAVVALLHVLESHEGRVAAFDHHAWFPVGFRAYVPAWRDHNHIPRRDAICHQSSSEQHATGRLHTKPSWAPVCPVRVQRDGRRGGVRPCVLPSRRI